ncbi:MAG: NAD(P)/FAD-dependent oxidoreductase [Vulcanimicrobiota bacterium]
MNKIFDAIIIGAGSVGTPLAAELSGQGMEVLVVEKNPSPGQGQNKAAIGGIRATFSDPGKIEVCRISLELLSTWKERHGDELGWIKGGYLFPVFSEELENQLKDLLKIQHEHGLNIDWVSPGRVKELVPGINDENLRGGTYSPDDGNISPLRAVNAFHRLAKNNGVTFQFNEQVTGVLAEKEKMQGVKTDKNTYYSNVVVNAAGADAREIGKMSGLDIQVFPDMHEAGITEPVKKFFDPLIVDLRKRPGSANFYFYQNFWHKIVFCMTPDPPLWGDNRQNSSDFLPQVSRRMIEVIPRLKNIRIRRTWRGLYPMTPDGIPIVDKVREIEGLYLAVGLCGQGLMLGPGLAKNLASLIMKGKPVINPRVFDDFSFYRSYHGAVEMLK